MINTTVPTTEQYQLKPESWGCVRCEDCKYRRDGVCKQLSYNRATTDLHVSLEIDIDWSQPEITIYVAPNFGCILGEREPIEDDEELAERLR